MGRREQIQTRSREVLEQSQDLGKRLAAAVNIPKPKLRGVVHQYAAVAALIAGVALIVIAPPGKAEVAAAIYAFSLVGLLTASALYHRIDWPEARRRWMRRIDHSMIYVFIAGTYTPFALLVFSDPLGTVLLAVLWGAALVGVLLSMFWPDAPKWVSSGIYLGLGWIALIGMPQMLDRAGIGAVTLVAIGGALYTCGAIVYARTRPDPWPQVFGYHEIFHVLVVLAATVQYIAIAVYALPAGA